MSKNRTSSLQRILAVLSQREPDRLPCSFMIFGGLNSACNDCVESVERQVEIGLGACVGLPPRPPLPVNDCYNLHGSPVSYVPLVVVKEWLANQPGKRDDTTRVTHLSLEPIRHPTALPPFP